MPASDILVIGGGIIGMMTARELARGGARVTVVEQGSIGSESSWAAAGMLGNPLPWTLPQALQPLMSWSQRTYPALTAALRFATGVDAEWSPDGVLLKGCNPDRDWLDTCNDPVLWLEPDAVALDEPSLAADGEGAWLLPGLAHVRMPRLLQALHQDLLNLGVQIRDHTRVTGLRVSGATVTGVCCETDSLFAAAVVIAAGAWSSDLLAPWGGKALGIHPVPGQILWYRTEPGLLRRMVCDGDLCVIPRRDGVVLVAATVEPTGFEKRITKEAAQRLSADAAALVPDLGAMTPAGQWSGLRPGRDNGIPVIGAHPRLQGLYVNAGHFREGIAIAPASARLLADLVLQRDLTFAVQHFSLPPMLPD